MLAGLKHLRHRRHDVVVFHVLDPAELEFPFRQTTLFRGMEQMPDVLTDPQALRRAYLDEFHKFQQSVNRGCRAQTSTMFYCARTSRWRSRCPAICRCACTASSNRDEPVALLIAFGFGNLLMLGWLAAAAAPILIHLWNKRKYREMHWAAIEYLLAAMRKNSRRMRLEQWLLLAVRTLIIMLVVFAVAQPFLEQAGFNFMPGGRTLKVLVLDGSYSMAYKPTDKSRFDSAKQWATRIVEESRQGDAFALVLMADRRRA